MIKYSIIIPHFNRPDLIMDCINSFNNLKDKEIIIIDDCSSKENLHQLKLNLKSLDSSQNVMLYETSEKLYLSKARNRGIDLAQGKWIFFIDDDDEATEKFISFLNSKKLKDNIDFYRFPNIERVDGKNKKFIFKWWHKKYSPQVSTFLFKKAFLKKFNLNFNEKIRYGEDFEFMTKIFNLKKIKSKYIHCFSFYYNSFSGLVSQMREKEQNPTRRLDAINFLINSNYKDKNASSLEFLISDFRFSYKRSFYKNDEETKKIYSNYYKKINPKFKDWLKINIIWKFEFFSLKRYLKD